MQRPTVLHVVEAWSRPSEGFVADLVTSATATRSVVVTKQRVAGSAGDAWHGPVHDVSSYARVPFHVSVAAWAALEHAQVVHAHFAHMANRAWRAARRLGVPLAVSVHGWDVLVAARDDRGIVEALRAADLVVVPSQFLARSVHELGVDPAVVRVVPSGLDLATLPWRERVRPSSSPVVTFAGRFTAKKGVLDVARALGLLARDGVDLQAQFVGFGPLERELRSLLDASPLRSQVVDGRPPGTVRAALAETDVVVTASRTAADGDAETLCLVNLEAQACGAPLVTTRHGGIPEAVDPAAAFFVDEAPDVTKPLAEAVRALLAAPDRWSQMGRAGRRFVAERYELGARTADMDRLWIALAAGRRREQLPSGMSPGAVTTRTSVVLVTHNRRALLERTLDALAAQTRPADEVVVVDNGSTDGTADLLAARARAGVPAGLRVLPRPANLPVAGGRNLAVGLATGDVIAFTDDDCRPRPTWLEALLAGMSDDISIVQGRTGADPGQELRPLSRTQWTPAEFGLYETCNIAYRRSAFAAARALPPDGPFDVGFADDVAQVLGERWARFPFAEDTELAWRVKHAGAASRFAVHAVVDHEVFPPDPGLLLRRAALAAAFPVLLQRVPELRTTFLWHRIVLGPHRARWWLAVGGGAAAVATRRAWPALAAAPYLASLAGGREALRPGRRRERLAAMPVLARRDLAETWALLRGSWRARSLVL